jgi:hypothetical protein
LLDPGFKGFVVTWNGTPTFVGKNLTQIHSLTKVGDAIIAVGQSSEKLLNTSLKGKTDGFLAKISAGKLISVQRSSDVNSNSRMAKR